MQRMGNNFCRCKNYGHRIFRESKHEKQVNTNTQSHEGELGSQSPLGRQCDAIRLMTEDASCISISAKLEFTQARLEERVIGGTLCSKYLCAANRWIIKMNSRVNFEDGGILIATGNLPRCDARLGSAPKYLRRDPKFNSADSLCTTNTRLIKLIRAACLREVRGF